MVKQIKRKRGVKRSSLRGIGPKRAARRATPGRGSGWEKRWDARHPSWEDDYFDNTKWTPWPSDPYGSWVTDHWQSQYEPEQYLLKISPINSWEEEYRPSKMRLTLSDTEYQFGVRLYDDNNNYIYSSLDGSWYTYQSGDIVDLNWTEPYDIQWLYIFTDITAPPNFDLEAIDFLP